MILIKRFFVLLLVLGIGLSTPAYSNEQSNNPKGLKQFLGEIKLPAFCMALGLGALKCLDWVKNRVVERNDGHMVQRGNTRFDNNDAIGEGFIRSLPFGKLFTGLAKLNIIYGSASLAWSLWNLCRRNLSRDCKSSKA